MALREPDHGIFYTSHRFRTGKDRYGQSFSFRALSLRVS